MGTVTVATATRTGPPAVEATVRQLSSINHLVELRNLLRVDQGLTVSPSPRSETEPPGRATKPASGEAEAASGEIRREPRLRVAMARRRASVERGRDCLLGLLDSDRDECGHFCLSP
jgi:hypothetical protein